MIEKDMQSLFTKHVKCHLPSASEVYELKICKGKSMPFNQLQPHQEAALLEASGKGLFHKITDQPWIQGRQYTFTAKKPFDCFAIVNAKAFVVIWFYHEREKKVFIKIPIEAFIKEREASLALKKPRKSLTEARAKEIGELMSI